MILISRYPTHVRRDNLWLLHFFGGVLCKPKTSFLEERGLLCCRFKQASRSDKSSHVKIKIELIWSKRSKFYRSKKEHLPSTNHHIKNINQHPSWTSIVLSVFHNNNKPTAQHIQILFLFDWSCPHSSQTWKRYSAIQPKTALPPPPPQHPTKQTMHQTSKKYKTNSQPTGPET